MYRLGFAAQQDEPIANVLHSVKLFLNSITEPFAKDKRELYLTGDGNFRTMVAKIKEYKGNRKDTAKPQYYDEIREYLMFHQGATMINFQEADDAIGIRQMELKGKGVIVSLDKDLDMIPGWHYKFTNNKLFYVNRNEADKWFFTQLLIGDATDNIPGIKGMGIKTAEKLLAKYNTPYDWHQICIDQYKKAYGDKKWESALSENAHLLWIRRKPDESCPWALTPLQDILSSTRKESESTTSPESDGESSQTNSDATPET